MLQKIRAKGGSAKLTFVCGLTLLLMSVSLAWGAKDTNKLTSLSLDSAATTPTVLLTTDEPVGYRYTVYDSFEPTRVVIDFPGMEIADLEEVLAVNQGTVQDVRLTAFKLSTGKLSRVEILLSESTDYQVSLDGKMFRVAFQTEMSSEPVTEKMESTPDVVMNEPTADPGVTADLLTSINVAANSVLLKGNGKIEKFKYFVLKKPSRLVVDVYGLRPGFKQRSFDLSDGFSKARVGAYTNKTRVVFDASGMQIPEHLVEDRNTDVAVSWGDHKQQMPVVEKKAPVSEKKAPMEAVEEPVAVQQDETVDTVVEEQKAPVTIPVAGPAVIEALDFINDDNSSVVLVSLSGPAKVTGPEQEGNLVRFEIADASINRALRRTIDASAFPSAVASVTPYTVKDGETQNVRIAVELKGAVAYALEQDDKSVKLVVDDAAFIEPPPPSVSQVEMVAPEKGMETVVEAEEKQMFEPTTETFTAEDMAAEAAKYTGEKITLVFDSANIRSILQLIGDVSGLNVLASSDVQGTVTLRLIDVPWDQALELVLDTADLGKIQQGNILRIMPKSKLREIEQEAMKEQMVAIEEGVLETKTFSISYASVDDMKGYLTDIKSERGSIIADSRNKQLIVRDAAAVLEQMDEMIAQIDKPERQVMIEARIVEANTNFTRSLGVKWNTSFDNDGDPSSDSFALNSMDLGAGGSFFIPVTNPASAGISTALNIGSLKNHFDLDLRLSALENSGEGRIISTPRITTLNGEQATISQGTKIPFSTVSDQGTEVTFESAELKLAVTPEINPDGSILLDISASNSSVGTVVPTASGDAVSIDEKKAQTKVLVRDGQTTVIGGIFIEQENESESGVPLLKDVPYLGRLFKSTTKSKDRRELLIFITPRIVQT